MYSQYGAEAPGRQLQQLQQQARSHVHQSCCSHRLNELFGNSGHQKCRKYYNVVDIVMDILMLHSAARHLVNGV